ncbi:unnamed protein product [Dicrocoelium dendriticum]|nr:unnamed protein product [Dicrocoelium dendriticum]
MKPLDNIIKLWRISERQKEAYNFNVCDEEGASSWSSETPDSLLYGPHIPTLLPFGELRVPRFRKSSQLIIESRLRRVFSNAHAYHTNSISVNSDQETFLSADDLRVNLWHLEVSDQSFNIVDTKPSDLEDLSEVITCARFHPSQCHLFAYSTSRGAIRLCDMRARALCDNHVLGLDTLTLSRHMYSLKRMT